MYHQFLETMSQHQVPGRRPQSSQPRKTPDTLFFFRQNTESGTQTTERPLNTTRNRTSCNETRDGSRSHRKILT